MHASSPRILKSLLVIDVIRLTSCCENILKSFQIWLCLPDKTRSVGAAISKLVANAPTVTATGNDEDEDDSPQTRKKFC